MSVATVSYRVGIIALLNICLLACSSHPFVGLRAEMPLLPLIGLTGSWQVTESLHYQTANGEPLSVLAVWSKQPTILQLVLLSHNGQTLATISYNGQRLKQQKNPLLGDGYTLPGRIMLSQLQFYHWPIKAVQQALSNSEWQFNVDSAQIKTLYYRNKPYTTFTPNKHGVVIHDLRANQHLQVQTLQKEPL